MKKACLYILSYISALLASVIGIVFGSLWATNVLIIVAFSVIAVLPVLLFASNLFFAKRFADKINRSKVAHMNDFWVSQRKDAERTAKERLKQLQNIRHLSTAYALLIVVLAISIAVFGGVLLAFHSYLYILCLLYSGLLFSSVFARFRKKRPLVLNEGTVYISEDDYPVIYSLARKAADTVGYKNEIIILPESDCSAGIIRDEKRAFVNLGVILLNVLSEEELYAILLHEFAHIADNDAAFREQQYHIWLCEESGGFNKLSAFLSNLYLYLGRKYIFNYMIYTYASSVINELTADKAMANYSTPKIAVSALLKSHYYNLYFWESCVKNEDSIYKPERLTANYITNKIESFKKAIAERSEFWNRLVDGEILANNASHPTLKMRMDALGIQKIELAEDESSEEYLAEIKKILEFSEKSIYDARKQTYEKDRNENYLQPLSRIEEWNKSGNPISAETYADIISDLKGIGMHEEAEALCDQVLEQLSGLSSVHAAFIKGAVMLYRYDDGGMELIYHAMEQNGNYIEEGLDIIGRFCCLTGRQEALLEHRKKALQLAQKHKDNDTQISFLSKNDNLTKETLPDGMLEEILAFIKSIDQDIIQNIYLVRKTVSETFFASVFIIHFYGGTDAQRDEIMHKIFRFLDSHPTEWQFSLFDYFEYPEVKVEKIEGSLVFTKDKK